MSETENIRKNLAIERMIIEGCEILLDTSQTFVRQGTPPTRAQVAVQQGGVSLGPLQRVCLQGVPRPLEGRGRCIHTWILWASPCPSLQR